MSIFTSSLPKHSVKNAGRVSVGVMVGVAVGVSVAEFV